MIETGSRISVLQSAIDCRMKVRARESKSFWRDQKMVDLRWKNIKSFPFCTVIKNMTESTLFVSLVPRPAVKFNDR